jgi:predicted DNA-binding WGR domain protein
MGPYEYTTVELQCINDRHYKFYRGYLDHQTNEVFYQYGRIGAFGTWSPAQAYESKSAAHAAMMKQLRSKFPKGYELTSTITILCAKKCDPTTLHVELGRAWRTIGEEKAGSLVIANV